MSVHLVATVPAPCRGPPVEWRTALARCRITSADNAVRPPPATFQESTPSETASGRDWAIARDNALAGPFDRAARLVGRQVAPGHSRSTNQGFQSSSHMTRWVS